MKMFFFKMKNPHIFGLWNDISVFSSLRDKVKCGVQGGWQFNSLTQASIAPSSLYIIVLEPFENLSMNAALHSLRRSAKSGINPPMVSARKTENHKKNFPWDISRVNRIVLEHFFMCWCMWCAICMTSDNF